jgi:DNA segregation ATPase FtsK/SpoIIIE-like protein
MPMQRRANLGNRLVLRVDGEGTSEIALGEKRAERLLGKGDLALSLRGKGNHFGQVPFVDGEDLATFLSYLTERSKDLYHIDNSSPIFFLGCKLLRSPGLLPQTVF